MPINFYRYLAPDQGYPPFGEMTLVDDYASAGKWSFGFRLGGGSMSARIPTAVIPVLPFADYAVSVDVRTEDLEHARAQLIAWFVDAHGNAIAASRQRSDTVRTNGSWRTLSLTMRGDYPQAADLVIALSLLQPQHLGAAVRDASRPVFEDTSGRAWFDELWIRHEPRVMMTTEPRGNVIPPNEPARLALLVRDVADADVSTRLVIRDVDDRVVHAQPIPVPRGPKPSIIELPIARAGWYRAILEIRSAPNTVRRSAISFIKLAPRRRGTRIADNPFGVVVENTSAQRLTKLPRMIEPMLVDRIALPVWPRVRAAPSTGQTSSVYRGELSTLLETMLQTGKSMTLTLNAVPRDLMEQGEYNEQQVLDVLASSPELWQNNLQEFLINFGLELPRWQVGAVESLSIVQHNDLSSSLVRANESFSRLVPQPTFVLPWPAEYDPPAPGSPNEPIGQSHTQAVVNVPHHLQPRQVASLASNWSAHENTSFVFQTPPNRSYAPRQRAADVMRRALYAWRGGGQRLSVITPWHEPANPRMDLNPDVLLPVWRVLCDQLTGREIVGELDVGEASHCWLLRGVNRNDAAIVAWTDRAMSSQQAVIDMTLGDQPVTVVDAFGNTRTVHPVDYRHRITLDTLPVFVENVNLELALFRASFAIEPNFIAAQNRVHEHDLVMRNPWPVSVSGTIRFRERADRSIEPQVHDFTAEPGSEIRVPVNVTLDRRVLAGGQEVEAQVDLTADQPYHLKMREKMQVGLKDLEVSVSWHVSRNPRTGQRDIIVMQYVTNTGERPLNVESFLIGPNISQQRKPITNLVPGTTVWRSFRIIDGVQRLAGRRLLTGVSHRDSVGRLNYMLDIPNLTEASERR